MNQVLPRIPDNLLNQLGGQRLREYLAGQRRYSDWHTFGDVIRLINANGIPPEAELWNRHITDAQKEIAFATGHIPVIGSEGGEWCVSADPNGTTTCLRKTFHYEWTPYCLVVSGVSTLDSAIAKVLLLQSDEHYFTNMAVRSDIPIMDYAWMQNTAWWTRHPLHITNG